MCYNQTGDISTLEGTPLKLVDKFTYLGSSVESTEKDIETRLAKAWTTIYIYIFSKIGRSTKRFVIFEFIYSFSSNIRVCFQFVAFVREHIWHKALLMGYSMKLELTCVCKTANTSE